MGNEGPWNNSAADDSRLNRMTIPCDTGANLALLNKTKHKLVACTATGSGFIVDHVYIANEAGNAWIDITGAAIHRHTGTTDGGRIMDIFRSNPKFLDTGPYFLFNIDKAKWIEAVTGTGAITNDTDGSTGELSIKFATGATNPSSCTISMKGLKLDFSDRFLFQTKLRLGTAANVAYHGGVNPDLVTDVDSNTQKVNAEVCTTLNGNWNLRTANGTDKDVSDTGIAITTNRVSVRVEHYPDTPKALVQIDTGTVLEKTSMIPNSSTTAVANLIRHSFKNSTGSDRTLFHYGSRLAYNIEDDWE